MRIMQQFDTTHENEFMELEKKFLWLTSPVLGKTQAESLVRLIWNFELEDSLDKMIDLCIVHHVPEI